MKKIIFFIYFLCFCAATYAQERSFKSFYVADSKVACEVNNTVTSCLKIKSHKDSNWKVFPYEIEGFIFEHGVECLIDVEEIPILFPEDNGPKYTYKLLKVMESHNTVLDNKLLLVGNKWKIISLEMERIVTPAKKTNAFIQFSIDSNRISGFGGCNSFSGNTNIENGVLQFGIFNSTLLACVNTDVETKIMEGLKGKAAFYIRNNILFIVCENHLVLHLRPEKRIDSLIMNLNKPVIVYRGNTIANLRNGNYAITLDDMKEAGSKSFVFVELNLSPTEKKTIRLRLKNFDAEDPIAMIIVLLKPHKKKGYYYATVIMKDGSKRSVELKNVL